MSGEIVVPVFKTLKELQNWREQHPNLDRGAEIIFFDRLQRVADAEFRGLENVESYVPAEHTDDFWKYNNVFDSDVYRQEVDRILPHNQFGEAPTVDQIKKWVEEDILYSSPVVERPTGIPFAEKELGIKLSGDYKFPDGMTSIEYGRQRFCRYGGSGVAPVRDFGYKELADGCSQREAYVEAWKRIHYNKDMLIENLKRDFMELCELNPELRKVKADTANKLWAAIDGVLYNFPADDIKLYVSADNPSNLNDEELFKVECMEAGIRPPGNLYWRISESTRKKVITQLKEKSKYQLSNVCKKTGVFGARYIDQSTGEVLLAVSSTNYREAMAEMMSWPENLKNAVKSVEHAAKKKVERATAKTAMMTQVKTAAKTEMSGLAAVKRVYDKMVGWLKNKVKGAWKSLTESPEEIERRQRKQQMTENKARAKASERLTIQRVQEKFKREQERKKKLLKREIRIENFDDFLLIQKELRENMQKTGTDECKVAQQICEDIIKMRRDNKEFREKYDAWQQKESKQIAECAKVDRRKQENKSNNTVPPTRGGGYTI